MDLLESVNWIYVTTAIIGVVIWKQFSLSKKQKKLDKWAEKSMKGKVILHGMYGSNKVLPSASPFVLKLETYLRFANIPYEVDKSDWWGKKGKTPWISYNGQHIADSQFIVEFLSREFGKESQAKYSEKERAVATMARVMIEEHAYWAGVMWRFAFGGKDTFAQVMSGEKTFVQWLIFTMIAPQMKSMARAQGLGRHSEDEIKALLIQDLRAISSVLGANKFLLGDEMCEDDCAVFAGLASAVFMPDSPLKAELDGEFRNLKDYCVRVRDILWTDWETAIKNS